MKVKTYADEQRGVQTNDLQAGDQALLKKKNTQTNCQPNLNVSLAKLLKRRAIVS